MRSNIFRRLYFKHSYIEIYAFVSLISISATEKLLPQLLFKKACLTTFNVSLDLCKSDPLMNDRIQKNLADLMTRKSVIKLFVSPLSTLAIICVLLFYKTIKIIGVQIITHLLIAILTLWYDSYTHISSATLVYLYAILISFSNFSALIVVFYDYIIHKSTLKKRILRFLMLNLAVKIGSIVGCTFFGVLLKYIGSFHTFIVFMTILFISTIIFFTIEDYSNENRAALKLIWMGPERNFISAFYASIKQNFEEFKKRRARQKLGIMFALIGNSLNSMIFYGCLSIDVIYLCSKYIKADSAFIGYHSSIENLISSANVLIMLPLIHRYTKTSDLHIIIMSGLISAVYLICFGFARSQTVIFSILPLVLFQDFKEILVTTRISNLFIGNQRTIFFGIDSFCFSIIGHLGGIIILSIYPHTLTVLPGLVYILMGLFAILPLVFHSLFFYFTEEDDGASREMLLDEISYDQTTDIL